MLQNYLKIALRNLLNNRTYSLINILGLSLGVACCLTLALYIQDEMSYDRHHARLDDLYRVVTVFTTARGIDKMSTTSPPIAMALHDEIPEVEAATRAINPPAVALNLIKYGDNLFYETDGYVADSTLFDILTYDFVEGNPLKALVEANSVVIGERLSRKLFGHEPALDKVINITQGGPTGDFKITGVFRDQRKSHLTANFFVSMTSGGWGEYIRTSNEWAGNNFVPAYVKLVPGHDKADVEKKMNAVLMKHGADAMKAVGFHKSLALQPVKDIYLKTDFGRSPRITYLYVIASIAIFILLIACINFMNLSTAKASKRAAEIGIRKVMGAFRSSLIKQLLGEALMIVLISIAGSIILVQLGLPYFNQLTGKSISLDSANLLYIGSALVLLTIITGIVAGSYPAFYLSSFQPAQVLKGKNTLTYSSGWLRRSLVVFQFMIAIALTCGMIIISEQLTYMQEKDLGFDPDANIVLPLRTRNARNGYESLRKELQKQSNILQVSGAEYVPGTRIWGDMMYYTEGKNMDQAILNLRNRIDFGYLELLHIKLIAGRFFTDDRVQESEKNVIINRTSAKKFGFEPEAIIDQPLYFDWQGKRSAFRVIGVVEDYHQTALKDAINPTMFDMAPDANHYQYLIASVNKETFSNTVLEIEKTWKRVINDTPFEYSFLDDSIQKQYDDDKKEASIITSFTFIAMAICCLGLYGLSSFMAERRFKEIGIRKVMGASINQIVGMMSKEFVRLVLVAFILAVPLAWYVMNQWLSGFAFRTPVNVWAFIYAGLAALSIALLTISFESIKAASANPVSSLRND